MEMRKSLILLPVMFFVVAMLVSCASHKGPNYTWPSTFKESRIKTTMFEVTGDQGERLKMKFDFDGNCQKIWINDQPVKCDEAGPLLEVTYFCIPPIRSRPANTDIYNDDNGKLDTYCGNIGFLTDGADIQFQPPSAAGNLKCKEVGGMVICY